MDYNKILWCIIIFFVNNIVIWFQLNSQLVWRWAKGPKSMILACVMGIPISMMFWYATKIGYQGFGTLWPVRFMGFATSMLTFPLLTYWFLNETITLKTAVTIMLSIVIMIIQIL